MKPAAKGDDVLEFERALAAGPDLPRYRLSLFVSGATPRSARAIQNIRALCDEKLAGRYELEVIDIYQHPERVAFESMVVTPTLVKTEPVPLRRIIGDLSDRARLAAGLDLDPGAAGGLGAGER